MENTSSVSPKLWPFERGSRWVTKPACSRWRYGQRISGLAVDGKVHELYRSPDPAALIGTLDRLMGDPGSAGGPVPGSTAGMGPAGGQAGAGRGSDR